jgi:hypothetical protein
LMPDNPIVWRQKMPDRKKLIYDLIVYELEFLHSNFDKHTLSEVADFFANGAFNSWTDEALQEKYNLFIKEENENA